MKSWAHTYLAGSLLGTFLIVAALIAFVPLVSLNAPSELPTLGLGLDNRGGNGDVGVSKATVAAAEQPRAGGSSSTVGGARVVADATSVSAQAPRREHQGRRAGAQADAPVNGVVAVSPAKVEVVARNPDSPAQKGANAGLPLPNPTEPGSAPVPAATEGEAGGRGETPSAAPIEAGTGGEGEEPHEEPQAEEEPQAPELPGSLPPPPSGSSTEGDEAPTGPEEGDAGEAAQAEDDNDPVSLDTYILPAL